MNLILIRGQLVNPPTWPPSFRDFTLWVHVFFKDKILIESVNTDQVWKWLKPRGGMDFIEDIIRPGSEDGIRIDTEPNFPKTIITDRIAPENVHKLISQVKNIRNL